MSDVPQRRAEDQANVSNRRRDAMFCAAYMAIAALCWIVIYEEKIGEFAQGIVTLVMGMFLNELKGMYSFETGTTRSSATKDATITSLTKSVSAGAQSPQATPEPQADKPV